MSEFLFNKIASLQGCNFIKKKIQHRCFRVKFEKFLRTLILKNIYKRCPNTAETTLHKKFTGAVLVQITYRRSHRRCSLKNMFFSEFRIIHRKTPVLESLFEKVAVL